MNRINCLCIGNYDKRFYIESWQQFANLPFLGQPPREKLLKLMKDVHIIFFFNQKYLYFSYFKLRRFFQPKSIFIFISSFTALFFQSKSICIFYFKLKRIFQPKNIDFFFFSNEYPQHMFSWRNTKNIYLIPTLI